MIEKHMPLSFQLPFTDHKKIQLIQLEDNSKSKLLLQHLIYDKWRTFMVEKYWMNFEVSDDSKYLMMTERRLESDWKVGF